MTRSLDVYVNQLRELTRAEWKLREQSTLLGFLWTLLGPLLMYVALYVVFTHWMRGYTADYAAYLLIGVVQYGFFSNATTYGISSLNRRRGILMSFKLPREILVLSACLSVAVSYFWELLLMLAFLLYLGTAPHWSWLLFPVILASQLLLVLGLSLHASLWSARYPDFERIWAILISVGFFLTPIFYTLDSVGGDRKRFLWLNPMTHVIEWSRACLLRAEALHWPQIAGLFLLSGAVAWSGYWVFKRRELRISDYVLP